MAWLRFAAVSLGLVALAAWGMSVLFTSADARHAIAVSAIVAYVTQLFTFAIARMGATTNLIAAWGIGAGLRFVVVAVFAFVAAKALALPMAPALLALVACFFVTSVVEPVLLRT